jgi:dTDP-4-dehydrorhamnose reductase
MTILLFGKNGQVGWELQRTLAPLGELTAVDFDSPADLCGDFNNPDGLRRTVQIVRPDIIVNAAAYTAVDKAESEPDLAMKINAEAPRVLAEEADALGACLVHYSTDFVFDGKKNQPYTELDQGNPLSEYGRSKLSGDLAVQEACSRHIIFRTSWVFGVHGSNFLKTILRLASERTELSVVADQVGTPTYASLIAETTATILATMANAPADDSRWGLYNLVSDGKTSWHGYAKYVVSQGRSKGLKLNLNPEAVAAITTEEYPLPAARPSYSVLDTMKLRSTFTLVLPSWKAGVDKVIDGLVSN